MSEQKGYSWLLGLYKTAKNVAVVLLPYAVLVSQDVPQEWSVAAALVVYWIKNFVGNWQHPSRPGK